jgi:2,3-dimethylmalate lyase
MLRLRDVLNARPRYRVITAPGVYDRVSLRMAASMGFDALHMTGYGSEAEMAEIGRELGDMPLVANMVEGGSTPMLTPARLAELGYALAIYPVAGLLGAAAALETVYRHIRETGSSLGSPAPLYAFAEMNRLMGFDEVWRFNQAHVEI